MSSCMQKHNVRSYCILVLTIFLPLLLSPPVAHAAQAAQVIAVDHRVTVTYTKPKFDPQQGTYSTQVQIKNHSSAPLLAPLRLNVNHLEDQVIQPLTSSGVGADGQPYLEFALPQGKLGAGKTTAAVTLVYKPEADQDKHKAHQQRRKKHNDEGGQITAGVAQAPLGLRVMPYALVSGGSPVDVRFGVHIINQDESKNAPATPVFLRNKDSGKIYPMHDHGRRANVASIKIDPSSMQAETCLNFEAYVVNRNAEVVSPTYRLCASSFPLSVAASNTATSVEFPDGMKAVADEVLIIVTPTTTESAIRQLADSINPSVVGTILPLNRYQLKLSSMATAEQLLSIVKKLSASNGIVSASVNTLGQAAFTPSDTDFAGQHGLQLVRAHDVWDANANGTGLTVVVLDTGIDRNHPDFGTSPGNCQLAEDDCGAGNTDVTTGPTAAGHGTLVSGTISAKTNNSLGVAGIANGSKIHSINVLGYTILNMESAFVDAATYVGMNGTARVVNASFNILDVFSNMTPLCTAINSVVLNGVTPRAVVVNSVGNDNLNGASYPSRCNDLNAGLTNKNLLLTVANSTSIVTSDCGSVAIDQRCSTSNFGAWVDIAAPGSAIRTTQLGGGYSNPTGTSLSAPIVSGAVAILSSCGVPLIDIESTLRTSALVNVTFPDATSAPRLDIFRALQQRNRIPTAVTLSNTSLSNGSNTTAGFEVGTLLATDLDTCDKFTYSIVGGADAAKFSIGGANSDRLRISDGVLNSSVKSSYTVTVRVTDFAGQTVDSTHVVTVTVPQCSDGIDNDGDGKIDYPADPGCSSASDTSENTNALPSAPTLVSPANNSINVNGASVTFKWNRATDPDGDAVSYDFYLCTNSSFTACGPVNVAANSLSETQLAGLLGGLGGSGFLLAGLMGAGRAQHKKFKAMLAIVMLLSLLGSCGGGGGGGGSGGSGGNGNGGSGNSNTVTHTVTMLTSATQYYWKVVAKDVNGGSTSSVVYSFTTN